MLSNKQTTFTEVQEPARARINPQKLVNIVMSILYIPVKNFATTSRKIKIFFRPPPHTRVHREAGSEREFKPREQINCACRYIYQQMVSSALFCLSADYILSDIFA